MNEIIPGKTKRAIPVASKESDFVAVEVLCVLKSTKPYKRYVLEFSGSVRVTAR